MCVCVQVSRAEGLLLQAQKKLKEEKLSEVMSLLEEVYTLLPHREPVLHPTAKLVSQKLDLCQVRHTHTLQAPHTVGQSKPLETTACSNIQRASVMWS